MNTLIKDAVFEDWKAPGWNLLMGLNLPDGGTITVLYRLTGYGCGDIFDTETGYRAPNGAFWLASGSFDIRDFPSLTISEAVEKIKYHANTCRGDEQWNRNFRYTR